MADTNEPSKSKYMHMSKWRTPDWRELCRERCLRRLRDARDSRSQLVERMRNISLSADDEDDDGVDPIDGIIRDEVKSFGAEIDINDEELNQYMLSVRQDFIDEQTKSWEGLQTKADQQRSVNFMHALESRRAILCPFCKEDELHLTHRYLQCSSCAIRFETSLTLDEIVARIYEVLSLHRRSQCADPYPQFNMFKSNLVIYCDTCPLNQLIL